MTGELPKVNPDVLQTATAAFGEAAETLSRLQADSPVGDAAAAVGSLLVAESCRKAQAGISVAVAAAVANVREYSENLDAALRAYAVADQSAAGDIGAIDIPT